MGDTFCVGVGVGARAILCARVTSSVQVGWLERFYCGKAKAEIMGHIIRREVVGNVREPITGRSRVETTIV